MPIKDLTIESYDDSAEKLAEFFSGFGPRVDDIDRAFELAPPQDKKLVIEIGCGDGRDALEIFKRTEKYIGFDPSQGMLDLAKEKLPDAKFVKADALSFLYPSNVSIVFSFASLLHSNETDVKEVINLVHDSLSLGGIFYISLKERDTYQMEKQIDEYGERVFFYYNLDEFKNYIDDKYEVAYEERQAVGSTNWFTIVLRKIK